MRARFREWLQGGGADFELLDGLDGRGDVRAPAEDFDFATTSRFAPGEIYDLFYENTTASGIRICRFWSKSDNPWTNGEIPELGDDVAGQVIAFTTETNQAIIKLDEPGDPRALTALADLEDLPEAPGRRRGRQLHLGDRVGGIVESVWPDELYIRISIRAFVEGQRAMAAQRNQRDEALSSIRDDHGEDSQKPARVQKALAGAKVVILDDDAAVRESTCRWLEEIGARATPVADLKSMRQALKDGVTHALIDFEGVRSADAVKLACEHGAAVAIWSGSGKSGRKQAAKLHVPFIAKPASLKLLEIWVRGGSVEVAEQPYKDGFAPEALLWTGRKAAGQVSRQAALYLDKLRKRHDLAACVWLRREREGVFSVQANSGVQVNEIRRVETKLARSAITRTIPNTSRAVPGETPDIATGVLPMHDPARPLLRMREEEGMHYFAISVLEAGAKPRCLVYFAPHAFGADLREKLVWEHDHALHLVQLFRLTEHVDATEAFATAGRVYAATIHEMRNKVTQVVALAASVQAAADKSGDSKVWRLAGDLNQTASELQQLADADLNQVRKFRRDRLNIVALVEKTVRRMRQIKRAQFAFESTQIAVRFDPRLRDKEISLSPIVLEQPLINLLDNALHHVGDHEWGRIEVEVAYDEKDGRTPIHIIVRDNGSGMPAATRETIFEPRETTKGERGAGMGLYASANIVRAAGGVLECTEALMWGGAEFRIRLPILLGPGDDG